MTKTKTVKLGKTGPEVFPLGFGAMGLSGAYGPTDDEESVRVLHAASERGVTLFDTGDFYGAGHNEMLLGRALRGRRDRVVLSVKFGALRGPDGSFGGVDARPVAVKNFAGYSLKRLGVDVIDVYRPARLDPQVPIEDSRTQLLSITLKTHQILDVAQKQMARVDDLMADATVRTRKQMVQAEAVLDDAMSRAHDTVAMVHGGIIKPLREINGVAAGIRAALHFMARTGRPTPDRLTVDEEMFI